jgi:predicted nucleotide-binding protein
MESPAQQLEHRSQVFADLNWQEASQRLQGLLEWMESQPEVKAILDNLDVEVDGMTLLNAADHHHPPAAGTESEIAAVGLALMRAAKDSPLFKIVTIKASGSSKFQDHVDSAVRRYLLPFVNFVSRRLAASQPDPGTPQLLSAQNMNTKDVFVVHGHDEAAKQAVARFLERLDLRPIILHEQKNSGRTIIEKFELHAEVQFAVIVLTPDDVGRLKAENESAARPRARQNVVFEMGYFIGRIGRDRVFPLKVGDVDIPSDYAGVAYTEMDGREAWKNELVRELKGVGFDIDANKIFN